MNEEEVAIFGADEIRELMDGIIDGIPAKTPTALVLLSLTAAYVKSALICGWTEQRILGVVAMAIEAYRPPAN